MRLDENRFPQCIGILRARAVLQQPLARRRLVVAARPQRLLDLIYVKAHVDERVDCVLQPTRLLVTLAVVANNLQKPFDFLFYTLRKGERRRKKNRYQNVCDGLIPSEWEKNLIRIKCTTNNVGTRCWNWGFHP